jgi:hypothetical protein
MTPYAVKFQLLAPMHELALLYYLWVSGFHVVGPERLRLIWNADSDWLAVSARGLTQAALSRTWLPKLATTGTNLYFKAAYVMGITSNLKFSSFRRDFHARGGSPAIPTRASPSSRFHDTDYDILKYVISYIITYDRSLISWAIMYDKCNWNHKSLIS